MAITNSSNAQLTFSNLPVGIQVTKVTDSSADWAGIANSTYFYDKGDGLVHYKNSSGTILELFSEGAASGKFGIANSSGVYTYYSTLQAAITAATSGQTVEFFTDYTETGNVTIILKNGVNINGNGHTYTLNNSGTDSCFSDNGVAVTSYISNISVKRIGATSASATNTTALLITGASKITSNGFYYGSKSASVIINNSSAEIIGLIADGDIGGNGYYTIIVTSGKLSNASATNRGNNYTYAIYNSGTISNCYALATSIGSGIYNLSLAENCVANVIGGDNFCRGILNENATAIGCTAYSSSSVGFTHYLNAISIDCKGYSTANIGFVINSYGNDVINCCGYSTSNAGISAYNVALYNCTGKSTASYGIYASNGGDGSTTIQNCVAQSTSLYGLYIDVAPSTPAYISNCTIYSSWNSNSGHAFVTNKSGSILVNSTLRVTASGANCIYSSSANTLKYSSNIYISSTTPVNANITQLIVNTQDNQGNILI